MLAFLHQVVDFTTLGLSPVALQVGPLALRWYSLAYIGGILIGWWLMTRMLRTPDAPMTTVQLDEFITWATLGVILGGRIAYVIFYDPGKFAADPLSVFKLWEGGMSFHGGVAGVLIAIALFARQQKISALCLLDLVACVQPIGQGLGRLANFVNGELWGRPTDGTWGIIFPDAGPEARHPSQLYEFALEGVILFAILQFLFWRTPARRYPGLLAGVYGVGYAVVRTIVENYREPDRQLGILSTGLTMGQTLSLPLFLAGAYLIVTARGRRAKAAN